MDREERLQRQKQFLVKFAYWAVWGTVGVFLVKLVGPVLLPFIAAFLVAWLLAFPVEYVAERTHVKRNVVAVAAVALFYTLLGMLLYLLCNRLVGLAQDMFGEVTVFLSDVIFPMIQNFCAWIDRIIGGAGAVRTAGTQGVQGVIGETGISGIASVAQAETERAVLRTGEMVSGMSKPVLDGVSELAASIPGICMNVLLAVIATVFMELDFPGMMAFLQKQVPREWQQTVAGIRAHAAEVMGKCVVSYILILGMTFAELTVGFLLLGIKGAFTIAFLIAALDILPVLGTGTVLLPWSVIAFASGNLKMGIGILTLYLLVTVVRNITEPRLVGRQIGLPPVVMLPCMILGLKFFGIFGLFGVPFGVAFLKSLNDRGVIHIFKSQ